MTATNKVLFTTIIVGLFFFGLYELTLGIALIGLFSWLVLVSVCIAGATMRHEQIEAPRYSRTTAKAMSSTHYTSGEWLILCEQYHWQCVACNNQRRLTADHVIPLYLGGSDDISNIQPLCKSCNSRKGTQTIDYR